MELLQREVEDFREERQKEEQVCSVTNVHLLRRALCQAKEKPPEDLLALIAQLQERQKQTDLLLKEKVNNKITYLTHRILIYIDRMRKLQLKRLL